MNKLIIILCAIFVSGCATQMTSDNSTPYKFDEKFNLLLTPDNTLKQNELNVIVLRPALRKVDLLGTYGNRQTEAESKAIQSKDYAAVLTTSSDLNVRYNPILSKCGFDINPASLLKQVRYEKPKLDIGISNAGDYYPAIQTWLEDAIVKPIFLTFSPTEQKCINAQGRYVLFLKHDQLSEIGYFQSDPNSFWNTYKRGVARNLIRGSQGTVQWNILNFIVLDTLDNRVLVSGDSWNLNDTNGELWNPSYASGLALTLKGLPQEYLKALKHRKEK